MLRTYATLLSALLLTCQTSAGESSGADLFQKGLAAYQNRNFEEARDSFQKVFEGDKSDARVLHNLALAHYQLNEKAHALALWRKALVIDPSYRAARTGRDLMESRFNMRALERDPFSASLRHTLEYVSLYELLWLVAVLLSLAGWLWIRYAAGRRTALDEEKPLPPFPFTASSVSAVLLVTCLLLYAKSADLLTSRATVVAGSASVRSLPSDESVTLFEIAGGNEVLVRREKDGWAQVQDSAGATGWVKKAEILISSER